MFPSSDITPPGHLVYVEWFSPLSATRDSSHRMYKVSRLMKDGRPHASIISVDSVISSIHLFPRFGQFDARNSNSFTVLNDCHSFYVNPFSDRDNYLIFS
jgi:hypothetical protein